MKLHIFESMYHIEGMGRQWKMKSQIFMDIDQLYLRSTRQFLKMLRKWKFPIFKIYGFYDFLLLKNINFTKNPSKF